ncbi:MAG TPA: MAPEG family protein, partial [Devosia sp.]|nr:MAPEG family protein [Devosia sp.]
ASRYVHAFIHLAGNHVPRRFFAYAVGVVVLAILWGELVTRLVVAIGAAS